MDYKRRDYQRILPFPKANFFLFGVRGSGKTSLLRKRFPGACYIDLLDEDVYQGYLADVSLFYRQIGALTDCDLVIVDEIQRMPQLLNEVHRLIRSVPRKTIYFNGLQCPENKSQGRKPVGRSGRMDRPLSLYPGGTRGRL